MSQRRTSEMTLCILSQILWMLSLEYCQHCMQWQNMGQYFASSLIQTKENEWMDGKLLNLHHVVPAQME